MKILRGIRIEIGTLAVLLVFAIALLSFAALADEVGEGETQKFDRAVLLAMRKASDPNQPIGPAWLPGVARDVTSLGSDAVLVMVTLGVAGFLVLSRAHAVAALVVVSVGGGMLLVRLLKNVFERTRPDVVNHAVQVFTSSFPSGHATMSAIAYLTLAALLTRVQPNPLLKAYVLSVGIALTLIVGVTRVYLGVHWPTDVLAGWCIGSVWAIACSLVMLRLQRSGRVEKRVKASHAS